MKKFFPRVILLLVPFFIAFLFLGDGPNSWTQLLPSVTVFNDCIAIDPSTPQTIYAGTNGAGVYKSTDGGATWNQVNTGLTDLSVQVLTISNSSPATLYAGCITGGVFKTTNGGTSWTAFNNGITELGKNVQAIAIKTNDPNTAVCVLYDGVNNATNGIYKTTDGGSTWAVSTTGVLSPNHNFLSLATSPSTPNTLYLGGTFVASTWGVHVYKSYNFGSTWIDISNGIDTTSVTGTDPFRDLSLSTIDTNTVLAGRFYNTTNGGPWLTTNAGANWIQRAGGLPTTGLIRSVKIRPGTNNQFFLGGNGAGAIIGGVFRTTNAGLNWFSFNSGAMDSIKTIRSLNFRTTPDTTLYAGAAAGSTGTGVFAYTFVPPPTPLCEGFNSTTFPPAGWSVTGTGSSFWSRQAFSGFGLGTGCADYNMYSAPNGDIGNLITKAFIPAVGGDSVKFDLAYCSWTSFPNDSLIILTSTNSGTTFNILVSWGETQLNTASSSCTHPFTPVANDWGRRKLALPLGTNMINFSGHSGFGDHLYLDSICVRGTDSLTGINLYSSGIPRQYQLSQNYPNPFNPSTVISYALPKAGYVQIKIYDLLGREVKTLVNEFKTAGYYKAEFNASNLASGVYFYKIESGTFSDTKKMLLIK
jgi:photosystem II stability/assembly factor-like uncharacterized protein